MNSSPKSAEHETPLVAEGGIARVPSAAADPYLAWMDLMEAVEALCPRWPERPASTVATDFRL